MSIFAAQHAGAVGKLGRLHTPEQIEVFLHRAIAERAVPAGSVAVPRGCGFPLRLVVDIGMAVLIRPSAQRKSRSK